MQQIVTFDSDEAVLCEGLPYETSIPRLPSIQHTDSSVHSVISFLQRPQLLSSFQWNSSIARSANIFKPAGRTDGLLVPSGLFSNRVMLARKLDGFTSFRATCVLKLQINAQPFQCGRLLMAAAPMPSLLGNRKQFIFSHVANAQNLNHVQMDIAKDTEVELRIPFISPYNCYDLIDGKFDWAEVRILVYSPLNAVESTCLQCLVYGHFEDIEMGAPTSGGVKQQSLMPSLKQVDDTKSQEATGKFTGALAQLGANLVSKGLSIVSPLTSTVDHAISAMGWSKPILAKPSRVFLNRPMEGFQYMDGVDQSLVLGITGANAIEPIKGLVGTNIDETSFDTLKRIPQMIGAFSYGNDIITCGGSGEPVKLWDCAVSPSCNIPACYYVQPTSTDPNVRNPYGLNWKQPTTLNYISSPFLYWKGSLVYTFKFVKTNYHSGRVEISYHPFVNTIDETRMDFVYRAVIDLRENSEISLTIPYIAAQPYKRISTYLDPVNPNPPSPGRLKDVIAGILCVRALTPLICATQIIANKIEVLVEMRAGDDFEVATPVTSKFLPFSFQNLNQVAEQAPPNVTRPKQQSGPILESYPIYASTFNGAPPSTKFVVNLKQQYENVYIRVETRMMRTSDFVGGPISQVSCPELNFKTNIMYPYTHFAGVQNTEMTWFCKVIPQQLNFYFIILVGGNPTILGANIFILDNVTIPTAIKGTDAFNVKIDPSQIPLPITSQDMHDVRIDSSQLPLEVKLSNDLTLGTVSIDKNQLPLWVSDYNVATDGPRNPTQQSSQLAMAGIVETRTRALEGWMPPSITGSSKDAHRPKLTNLCIGENFTSFRQYAKRFAFCMVSGLDSRKMLSVQPVELIRPGALYLRPTEASTGNNENTQLCLYGPNSSSELSGSPLAFVAGMYAFYRGSVRVKTWTDPRQNPPNLLSGHLEYSRQIVDTNIINDNIENFMTPIAYETPMSKQIPEFQVPYYSPTIVSSTWSHGVDNQFDVPLVNLVLSIPDFQSNKTVYPIKIAVAAGDDMDFHQFIGPPPVINVGDLTIENRKIHYPPTGFTPTQKIALDTDENTRTELPASSYIPVTYSSMTMVPNITGASCPALPTPAKAKSKIVKRSIEGSQGSDTVDHKQSGSSPCPCSHSSLSDYEIE